MIRDLAVLACIIVSTLLPDAALAGAFFQTNLTSDLPGFAANLDPNLVNPWGIAFGPSTPFWISDNRKGLSALYNGAGQSFPVGSPLVVTIYFTAGIPGPGQIEDHGLFGELQVRATPAPATLTLLGVALFGSLAFRALTRRRTTV
jgi:hypothetical protein